MSRRTKGSERAGHAERLVAVRKRLRSRQIDVARELGLSRATISRIENDYVARNAVRRRVGAWLEAKEAEIAAAGEPAASEPAGPERLPPRVPVQVRLAMLRMLGRTQREGRKRQKSEESAVWRLSAGIFSARKA